MGLHAGICWEAIVVGLAVLIGFAVQCGYNLAVLHGLKRDVGDVKRHVFNGLSSRSEKLERWAVRMESKFDVLKCVRETSANKK